MLSHISLKLYFQLDISNELSIYTEIWVYITRFGYNITRFQYNVTRFQYNVMKFRYIYSNLGIYTEILFQSSTELVISYTDFVSLP